MACHHGDVIECAPVISEDIEEVIGSIDAGATFSQTFAIVGLEEGRQELVASLHSSQVELVSGEAEVTVDEGSEETDSPSVPDVVRVRSIDRNLSTNRRVSSSPLCLSVCLSLS